jgi:hypothetical protein
LLGKETSGEPGARSQESWVTSHTVHHPSVTSGRLLSSIRVLSP